MMRLAENITSGPKNIKRHLIGEEKIITLNFKNIIRNPRIITLTPILILMAFISTTLNLNPAFALTYQDEVDVQFTFDPTLSISLSSNSLTISNLVPGNYDNSNTISINVSTNNVYGYTLSAKVGGEGETDASSDLVNTTAGTTFASLASTDNLTLANFDDNTWGYTTASTVSTNSTYSGLVYNVNKTINSTTNSTGTAATGYNGTNTTNFTIGAKASTTQLAGDYTNTITFTAVANSASIAIQDINLTTCSVNVGTNGNPANIGDNITVYDRRDNNTYTIRYINGQCWMTQNLRFADTSLDPSTTNIDAAKTMTYYSLDSNDSSYADHCDGDSNGYNYSCIKDSGNVIAGVWYNFTAASAETITGYPNNANTNYDICPKGWRLPNGPSIIEGADFNILVGNTNTAWQIATSGLSAFGAVAYGIYNYGEIINPTESSWWASLASSVGSRFLLFYNNSNGNFRSNTGNNRFFGRFVRCVLK